MTAPVFADPLAGTAGQERLELLLKLSEESIETDSGQSLAYAEEAVQLAAELKAPTLEADAHNSAGYALFQQAEYPKAIESFQNALDLSVTQGYEKGIGFSHNGFGLIWLVLGDYPRAQDDFEAALEHFQAASDRQGEAYAINNIGAVYESTGALDKALEQYLEALRINEALKNQDEMAVSYNNIGNINAAENNYEGAFKYYSMALDLYTASGNAIGVADTQLNLGGFFRDFGYLEEALSFYEKAMETADAIGSKTKKASILNSIADIQERLQNDPKAETLYLEAAALSESIGSSEILANSWNNLGTLMHRQGRFQEALDYHIQAFEKSKEINFEEGLDSGLKNIAMDYQSMGDFQNANHYFILYNDFRNAMEEQRQSKNFANSQVMYETEKKNEQIAEQQETLLRKEREARIMIGVIAGTVLFLGIVTFLAMAISKEKKRSEALLLNILPRKVADALKATGRTIPERFEHVTVLFSDIVGFTSISSAMDPDTLVKELNDIFTLFDAIMDKHQCERIKTIGDAYFAVCGMPVPNEDHVRHMVEAGREMLQALEERNRLTGMEWRIRVGIHSGPVVGSVVGVKKYIYDIFGDTVNTASRMESNGAPMRINLSESTRMLLGDAYRFDERPPVEVKGKGVYKMYFLAEETP